MAFFLGKCVYPVVSNEEIILETCYKDSFLLCQRNGYHPLSCDLLCFMQYSFENRKWIKYVHDTQNKQDAMKLTVSWKWRVEDVIQRLCNLCLI